MKTWQEYLLEEEHPFRYAYKINNSVEQKQAEHVFEWVCKKLKLTSTPPEFWVVGHDHMQDAAKKVSHFNSINGHIFGWFSDRYPDKIFLSDRIKLASNKQAQAVLAHEVTHYLQYHEMTHSGETTMQDLEDQADNIMGEYLGLATTQTRNK